MICIVFCMLYRYTCILGAIGFPGPKYGAGTGTIFLDNVVCMGSETLLISCSYTTDVSASCNHIDDVGVRCQGYTLNAVHLVMNVLK